MKLALMADGIGSLVTAEELRPLGFKEVQMFFGSGPGGDDEDPSPEAVDALLGVGHVALAAITLHLFSQRLIVRAATAGAIQGE